ncbi:MAG: ABC transporter ATP-binding protein [Candidatus Aminicenantes bacterium]|nr:ABC transporter ATP-binding protein [Candidatus Aminicenantes bacterium]
MKLRDYLKEAAQDIKTKEKSQKFSFSSLKRFFPYIKEHWKKFAFGSFLMIVVSLLALPTPYIMKYIVDDIIAAKNIKYLHLAVLILLGIQLIKLVISFFTNYFFNIFNQEIIFRVKKDLFHRILRLPLSFFDKNQTGYLLSRIREVEGLRIFFSNSLVRFIIGIFEFIFSLVILFYLNWRLTIASILILPLFYFAARFYAGGIRKVSKEVMEKWALLSRRIQDSLSGVDVVKIFSAEERETNSIHNHLEDLKRSDIKQNIISSFSSEFMSLIGALGGFLVLWFGGINIIKGTFTIGGYIAFTGYLAKLYGPTQSIAMQGLSFQPAITALNRVSEFSSISQEEEDPDRKIEIPGINRIEFKNVTFSYGKKKALENINLTINRNDKVLITGPNGSGKSTMVKLILSLYKIKQGKLFINNQDINNISLSSLRDKISFVSQNVFLFNDTIRNNILYSKPEATAEEVEKAAKLSGSSDFINKLDEKMNVIVGETGRMISGGEKQKISIARAILKDSDVVIFDEATSQQDAQYIERIEALIEKRFKDKICIIISHRSIKNLKLTKTIRLQDGSIR